MKTYIVSIESDGSFKAEELVGFDSPVDSFQCKYWHVFARELECRLMVAKREKLLETSTVEKKSKSDAGIF